MCGRFTLTKIDDLVEVFELDERPDLLPRYNIAPTHDAPVVRLARDGSRRLGMMHWGLIPYWSGPPDNPARMINARCETVDRRPAFRDAFRRRRCLVPADGFYEWKKTDGRRQPYHFTLAEGGLFAFAGLWERWRDGEGGSKESFTILTTDSNDTVAEIHDRMPVILAPERFAIWLDREAPASALRALMAPFPSDRMRARPVSRLVNSPRNDSPECLRPPDRETGSRQGSLF